MAEVKTIPGSGMMMVALATMDNRKMPTYP